MAQYGRRTADKLDMPLKKLSVVTQWLGDNGYGSAFEGSNEIYIMAIASKSLVTYNESAAADSFGSITLSTPSDTAFAIDYNKAVATRFQKTQLQDVPIADLAMDWAAQQISETFIPDFDEYALNKMVAAVPVGNRITVGADLEAETKLSLKFGYAINKARVAGATNTNSMVAWLNYDFAANLANQINFTGSDAGYKDAEAGYLGKHKGVVCIETPNEYFNGAVKVLIADKRAVVNIRPKASTGSIQVIDKVEGFDGKEVRIRLRTLTFVLPNKVNNLAVITDGYSSVV